MAVGLALTGHLVPDHRITLAEARDWLARAAVWFEAVGDAVLDTRLGRDADDKPFVAVTFHPVGDPLELRLGGGGKVKVLARTSPVGPGYHAYVCELLKQFAADFELVWDDPPPDHDPARYFVTGDQGKLERQFLNWLSTECSAALRNPPPHHIGMPRQPKFLHPGPVLTPLGPEPLAWLNHIVSEPTAGADFFPWWSPDIDATFFSRRASAELWLAFPWRPPLTEAEGELVDQIAADLANAYDLSRDVALSWGGWSAVIDAITHDTRQLTVEPVSPELRQLVKVTADGATAIGYRQFPVEQTLSGGWHIELPGRLALTRASDGRTWTAWDDRRTVWFRDQSFGHPEGGGPTAEQAVEAARKNLPIGEALPHRTCAGHVGEAVFGPFTEDGKSLVRLCGAVAHGSRLAVCNIYSADATDRDWMIHTWQSLVRPGSQPR